MCCRARSRVIMLEVDDLYFDYSDRKVLQGVHFQVGAGELLHLRGANGCGKTTLLKLLVGLLTPCEGTIRFEGKHIANDLPLYRQELCYVGHKGGVSPMLTVKEHYQFELQRHEQSSSLDAVLSWLNLSGTEDVLCGQLSVGMRRKVGLMRLLLSTAKLWFLDEPLTALDQQGIESLMSAFENHLSKGGMIVLTSHQAIPTITPKQHEYNL